jgi:hypothetical protein
MITFGHLDTGDKVYVLNNPKVFAPDYWLEVREVLWVERHLDMKNPFIVLHITDAKTKNTSTLALDYTDTKQSNLSRNKDGVIRRYISDPEELKKNINWMADDYIKSQENAIRNNKIYIKESKKRIRSCKNVKKRFKI